MYIPLYLIYRTKILIHSGGSAMTKDMIEVLLPSRMKAGDVNDEKNQRETNKQKHVINYSKWSDSIIVGILLRRSHSLPFSCILPVEATKFLSLCPAQN